MILRLLALVFALLGSTSLLRAEMRTWTDKDGQTRQAEAVSVRGAMVELRREDGQKMFFPIKHLCAEDQALLQQMFPVEMTPRPKASRDGKALIAADAAPRPGSPQAAATSSEPMGLIAQELKGHLVRWSNGQLVPAAADALSGVRYLAIYFSAAWCGPCRKFTPDLVGFYKSFKSSHPEFELVFVSEDESAENMAAYMRADGMPWPALRYADRSAVPRVNALAGDGIPNLVLVDVSGKVISSSYQDGRYRGPRAVLQDIARLKTP